MLQELISRPTMSDRELLTFPDRVGVSGVGVIESRVALTLTPLSPNLSFVDESPLRPPHIYAQHPGTCRECQIFLKETFK